MPATIVHIPKAFVKPLEYDPPSDDASVIRAQAATITELQRILREMARTPDPFEVLDTTEALERLAARVGGWPRLVFIFRQVVALNGHDMDRPLGNCLADGMLLPPSRVCNFCGRDNS